MKVSIIIVNWNGFTYLKDCLSSVSSQTFTDYEIIVVDNGSDDGSIEFIDAHYPQINLVKNAENTGFAKAVNQGISIAKGIYIALLNNDTVVDPGWLSTSVSLMESESKIGMIAPKILRLDQSNIIDSAGVGIYPDGMSRGRGRLEKDTGQFDVIEEVLVPSGCSALYRKEMFDEIGLFDETFFAYCEDTDLGIRGRLAGWKTYYCPDTIVYHNYSGTSGQASPMKAYYVERNHVWVAAKNFPLSVCLIVPFYTAWRFWMVLVSGLILKRGSTGEYTGIYSYLSLFKIVLTSYKDAIKRLPEMMKKRKQVKQLKKISNKELKNLLIKHRLPVKNLI